MTYRPGAGGGTPSWAGISGKPANFPPEAHTQAIATITGLQTALNAKAATSEMGTAAAADTGDFEAAGAVAAGIAAHNGALDPHSQYAREIDVGVSIAPLVGGLVPLANLPSLPAVNASLSAALSADVAMATTGTWYDGPAISLTAGTWLVMGAIQFKRTATTATQWIGRISTGTVHYASGQTYTASLANITAALALHAIVTVASTTTVKMQGTTSAGAAACRMSAATPNSSSGNNATQIVAIKLG